MSPERPKFLVLTPALDGADGISELSRQVVRALSAHAVGLPADVEVWTLGGGAAASIASGVIQRSARGSRFAMLRWTLARASRSLRGLTIVVVHAHLSPLAAALAARGARVVMFLVGVEVWGRLRRRERYAIEHADCLLAISGYTARRFREANPDVRVNTVSVCHPGIRSVQALHTDVPPAGFALIVGRLWSAERYKGHDRLIDIWPAVRARVADATLVVVGDGDDRARLEARAAANGLGDAVRFTGRIDDYELAALYTASAFFVMPSTSEGFGLAYLEAMRAGRPCIALHGAADEIIEHDVSGILVDDGDCDALAGAIVRLFTDRGLCAGMGAAARSRVARAFTEEHFARRFRAALGLSTGRPSVAVTARAAAGAR